MPLLFMVNQGIPLNHLLRNKRSTERKKDQADVELLLKLQRKKGKK